MVLVQIQLLEAQEEQTTVRVEEPVVLALITRGQTMVAVEQVVEIAKEVAEAQGLF
jgi:hypothetical protein